VERTADGVDVTGDRAHEPPPLVDVQVHEVPGGSIRVLTMQRPTARNAMDSALLSALLDALDDAEREPTLRGVVLTGAGGSFSAGADVREVLADGGRRRMELFTALYEQLSLFRLPTAAAVEGFAVGGGAEAAIACDLRVAGESASFRFPGVIYGVPVGVARTVGQVGLSVAKDWVLSGRDVPASEAEHRGLVQRVVADGEALATALAWLTTTATRDADTVDLLKRMFNEQAGLRDRVAFENDALRAQAETGKLRPDLGGDLPRTVRPRRR
jgi:enoyl-CoA hydratase/carnithine racemase